MTLRGKSETISKISSGRDCIMIIMSTGGCFVELDIGHIHHRVTEGWSRHKPYMKVNISKPSEF